MLNRASGALLFSYIVILIAGIVFIFSPSPVLQEVAMYQSTVIIWGLFYVVGGFTSSSCILLRRFVKNTIPLWYFEVAGISLIVAANIVYAYAIAQASMEFQEPSIYGASFLIIAFSGGLFARIIETLRLVKVIKVYAQTDSGDHE